MDQRLMLSVVLTIFVSFQYEAVATPPLRIVNGTTAEEGEFPYMVEVRSRNGYFTCGGAILSPEWIVTAAHCVEGGPPFVQTIVYGTNQLYDYNEGYPNTSINVINGLQHPKFTRTPLRIPIYDIGLLQLETPIPLGPRAQAIKLADANATIPTSVEGVLTGWGLNNTGGDPMRYLQKINLPLLTDEECKKKIDEYEGEDLYIPAHNLCTDDYYDGQCFGDSGSPYVINGIQYGVVSWSIKPCGILPGTYSRIPNPEYRNWITEVTNI